MSAEYRQGDIQDLSQNPFTIKTGQLSTTRGTTKEIPQRFLEPGAWTYEPRKQNPCYKTCNNVYGLKKPSQVEMPETYASTSQKFSSTFYGGVGKVSSMNTAVTRSKVHKLLDDF
jgi:hypothetical protein